MINVKEIIAQSWKIYEDNFKLLIKIAICGFIVMTISMAAYYLTEIFLGGIPARLRILLMVLINIPQFLIIIWMSLALIIAINKISGHEKIEFNDVVKISVKYYIPVFCASVIIGIINTIGFLFFIIPGLIFGVWFAFSAYEIMFNNKKIIDSLKSSRELSRGRWFEVAWRYFAPSLFWGVSGWFATNIILFAVKQTLYLTKTSLDAITGNILEFLAIVLENAVYVFFVPLMIGTVVILYRQLKADQPRI